MKLIRLLIILIIVGVAGLWVWFSMNTSAVNTADTHNEIFVVGKGQGAKAIAKNLEEQKLIKNQFAFYLLVKKMGIEDKIQAGSFRLSPSLSSEGIATALTKGSLDVWVTIPEGKRADEIADLLKAALPSYKEDWREKLQAEEGYLFPDTYLFPLDSTIESVISIMKNTFDQKYKTLTNKKATMTQHEIVTIASLIEREGKHDEDRPLIASVIYNRLELGMPVQIDATIQYVLGYQADEQSWWKRHLSLDDLKVQSAYNTYKNTGLPPTPIASPGIKALEAAMNPADTDYLFYITDKNGINHYAKTNAEHEKNIATYGL